MKFYQNNLFENLNIAKVVQFFDMRFYFSNVFFLNNLHYQNLGNIFTIHKINIKIN